MCVFVQSIGVDDVVASVEPIENVRVLFVGGGVGKERGGKEGVWALGREVGGKVKGLGLLGTTCHRRFAHPHSLASHSLSLVSIQSIHSVHWSKPGSSRPQWNGSHSR